MAKLLKDMTPKKRLIAIDKNIDLLGYCTSSLMNLRNKTIEEINHENRLLKEQK